MNHKRAILTVFILAFLSQVCSFKNPPVLTINTTDGDIIDCVNREEQPAFDHPLLKNHKIQEAPSELPKMNKEIKESNKSETWNINKIICPNNTIPIRRQNTTTSFIKKQLYSGFNRPENTYNPGHEYAFAYMENPLETYGTSVTLNVWKPTVEDESEFSLAQAWVSSGRIDDSHDLNTIEVGWQVYPYRYKDDEPHFFIYWTCDTYGPRGCYNFDCPGFVQISSSFVIGSPILTSLSNGIQFEVTFLIWKDRNYNSWWLSVGLGPDNTVVGYWPAEILTHLADGPAESVKWGGEIVNNRIFQRHTKTQMGSGQFAEQGYGKASYFRNLGIIDEMNIVQPLPQNIRLEATNPTCYDAQITENDALGIDFYYGGPGFNPLCI